MDSDYTFFADGLYETKGLDYRDLTPPPFFETRQILPSFDKLLIVERLNGEPVEPFSSIPDSPPSVKKNPDRIVSQNADNGLKIKKAGVRPVLTCNPVQNDSRVVIMSIS